jgi:hypothetical protein
MRTIAEPSRQVPVAHEADVCVIGGSCTGVFAAVAAGRMGARVALVEANGLLGGTATAGLVCVWHTMLDTTFTRPVIGGLTAETLDRLRRRDAMWPTRPSPNMNYIFNPHELAIELDAMVLEVKARPFLHARFVAPVVEDGRVTAAIIEDKTGRRAIRARCFIDATGDGDLLVRAGLPVRTPAGIELQPPTACAVFRHLDALGKRDPQFNLHRVFDPQFPEALNKGFLWFVPMVGAIDETMVAGTRVSAANCADADELTAAEIEGRRQIRRMTDLYRTRFRGGEQVTLAAIPSHIGVRETRHAECLHRLTESELLTGTRFDDAVANGTYRVDVHHSDKPGLTFRYLNGEEVYVTEDGTSVRSRWRPQQPEDPTFYQIPYRSLLPRGASNVLACGRLIDADRGAYGAIRVMVNCNQTGQAAGVAAALAVRANRSVADIDVKQLRQTLKDQGAVIL